MKILVLGGAGFIGTNFSIEAIKRGHTIVGFDNLSRNEVKNNLVYLEKTYKDKYKFVWGDVRKEDDFEKVPTVDAVVNYAANPSVIKSIAYPRYDYETNSGGVFNSLQFARKHTIPYIYASTNKVYSDISNKMYMNEKQTRLEWGIDTSLNRFNPMTAGITFSEDNLIPVAINDKFPVDGFGKFGHSLYGKSKLSGEMYVQEYGIQFNIPIVIFRMSCIYGLFQKGVVEQAWIDWFLRKILLGDGKIEIYGSGKQVRDVLDGRDTVRAYLDALENIESVKGEVFTLGGGKDNAFSLIETISIIENMTGKKATISFEKKRPSDQDIYISCIKKLKDKLNWEPKINLQTALSDMIYQYTHE